MSRPFAIAAYGLVALAIAFELTVLWQMLHPNVSNDYRGYYIDQTITCLNQPVSGDYVLGEKISFQSEGYDAAKAKPLRVCGWEGPAGDGTHAVGTASRLRFSFSATEQALTLSLELTTIDQVTSQEVFVMINDEVGETMLVMSGAPQMHAVAVPPAAAAAGVVDVMFGYPQALRMRPGDSDSRLRSIKLLSARLAAQ